MQYQFDNVILGSVETDERTQFPKGFEDGKTYILVYYTRHHVAYQFILPE